MERERDRETERQRDGERQRETETESEGRGVRVSEWERERERERERMCGCMHVYWRVCMRACVCVFVRVCACVCGCLCVYVRGGGCSCACVNVYSMCKTGQQCTVHFDCGGGGGMILISDLFAHGKSSVMCHMNVRKGRKAIVHITPCRCALAVCSVVGIPCGCRK